MNNELPPLPDIVQRADAHYAGEGLADAVRTYAAAVAAAVPPGWKLVPVRPTDVMVYAGKEQTNKNAGGCRLARKAWASMLAAAPEAPR